MKDNNTEISECCPVKEMYGFKYHGILLNTGVFYPRNMKDDWLKFINTHDNSVGHLSSKWPLIACANDPEIEEGGFGDNCTLCVFQPSVDEWYDWYKSVYSAEILDLMAGFIKTKGLSTVSYPWEHIMGGLAEEVADLKHPTLEGYDDAVGGMEHIFSKSLLDDLWAFLNATR